MPIVNLQNPISKLMGKEIQFVVKNVADCLINGWDFPEVVGEPYTVTRYINGIYSPISYLPIFGGFDIETTNIITETSKHAYMYHAQGSVFSWDRGVVYISRTWEEVKAYFEALNDHYKLGGGVRIVQAIANAGFEFQFMRKRFAWSKEPFDFFAKEERQPLLFVYKGIEFRDCLAVSGGSLAHLCKDYCYTQKSVNDLDYSILRNSHSELDEIERGYTVGDVVPLAEYMCYLYETFCKDGSGLPLTKTGILRAEVKKAAKEMLKGRASKWKKLLNTAFPDKDTYDTWVRFLFRGGYVHGNVAYSGYLLYNLLCYDITSSYPTSILLWKMPGVYHPLSQDCCNLEFLKKMAEDEDKAFYCKATFYKVRAKYSHSIESYSKCISCHGFELDNGRIRTAEEMTVMIDNNDLLNYLDFYDFDDVDFEFVQWADTMWLPPYLVEVLKKYYIQKAELKQNGQGDTPEYALIKAMVNACFGLCVQHLEQDLFTYDDGWKHLENVRDFDEQADRAILLPQWGIAIASRSRRNLLKTIARIEREVGKDYEGGCCCYSDTDSIKCINDPRIATIIEEYNEDIRKRLKARGLTDPAFKGLGEFDFEMLAKKAKFLGAKRYMVTYYDKKKGEDVTKATIAGLPKVAVSELTDPYKSFTPRGMLIPKDKSHKTTHAYNDEPTSDWVDGELMSELSSVAIYDIPFSLKIDDDYQYLMMFGWLLKEVS